VSTIETTTGLAFNPFQPDPAQIDVRDITTSLSRINRYLGHGRLPWSVLAHSVCVAGMVPAEHRLTALLHDATEAYLGDVPAPIKSLGFLDPYRHAESLLWKAIAKRFGLPNEIPEIVNAADQAMRYHEAKMLMKHPLADCWKQYQAEARRFVPPPQSFRRLSDANHAQERWLAMFRLHYKGPHP
jgi:hypothetical protein